jgi:tetratricopeptide (TPR) repeat protein
MAMNNFSGNYFLLFIIFLMFSITLSAQFESRGSNFNSLDAETFYKAGNYYDALPLYELLKEEKPKMMEYQMKLGICHLRINQNPLKAIEVIKKVYDINPKTQNVAYYLGKAYALNYKFNLAIEFYEKALLSEKTNPYLKKKIPHLIGQSKNGLEIVKDSLSVEIINIGGPVNTIANEYSPIISADESTLIFTYRGISSMGGRMNKFNKSKVNGSFNEDIFISSLNNNLWDEPKSISDSINSILNEGGISLTPDGEKLYLYKDTKGASGDIYESVKVDGDWSEPKNLNINSRYWEGHATISSKGNMIIFSSSRPGGLGGKDLYSALLQEDGSWAEVENLGATINTIYDEDAPFFNSDGEMFNFSSKGHTSIGGYDIFESKIESDSVFSSPVNIGFPINTTSDDVFYYVSKNDNVYYSSARRGGYGQNDIYLINVNGINITGVALLYKDPLSPITNLRVNITNKDRTFSLTDTTDGAGRYNFSKLSGDDDYILFIDEIDEKEIDNSIYFFKGEVTKMGRAFTKSSLNDSTVNDSGSYNIEVENTQYGNEAKSDSLNEKMTDEEILAEYGVKTALGLVYKVQVAALANPQNFDGSNLEMLGVIEKIVLEDGLTRFTVGSFKVLKDASALLESSKSKGLNDAFIIVFVDGKRKYLEDLINTGVLK